MDLNCLIFLKPPLKAILKTLKLFVFFYWIACAPSREESDIMLHFPQKFSFEEIKNVYATVVYNNDGTYIALDSSQTGTFKAFIDTISSFIRIENMRIPFTSVEFLDTNRVRLLSDGSLGIPALDSIVNYSREDVGGLSNITISWDQTVLPPLLCQLSAWTGQNLGFTTAIYTYTYRPFTPPFAQYHTNSLSFAYLESTPLSTLLFHMRTGAYGHDYEFTNRDTLAVQWVAVTFR